MKSSRWIWGTVGLTGLLATIVFVIGFVYAVNQILFPKAGGSEFAVSSPQSRKETIAEGKSKLQIVALGDSLTAGTGDNTGKGYVGRVREKLEQQTGKAVFILNNLAIPGYKSDQLLKDLELKKTQEALAEADIVLLTIGGNDIFAGGAGILSEDQQEFNPEAAEQRVGPALQRMDTILSGIRKANPNAVVLYVGLYHPFLDLDPERKGSLIVQKWNDGVFALTNRYANMIVVPTYDLFEQNLLKYISSADHFHPNGDGYERIADRIVQILQ